MFCFALLCWFFGILRSYVLKKIRKINNNDRVQYSTVQHSTAQTAQYSTVQYAELFVTPSRNMMGEESYS
jgi:hypothetical protein